MDFPAITFYGHNSQRDFVKTFTEKLISDLDISNEVKEVVYGTPPGITGVGSLVFRDEESIIDQSELPPREFYEKFIIPYKGKIEMWYQANQTIWLDIKIIFLTAWAILFPSSDLHYKMLKNLPKRNF